MMSNVVSDNNRLTRRLASLEQCEDTPYYVVKGMVINRGERLGIVMKGRGREELECELICYNYIYATLLVRCSDNTVRVIKFSDVKQIIKHDSNEYYMGEGNEHK